MTLSSQIAPIYSNTAMLLVRLRLFDNNWIQKLKPKIIAQRDYKNVDNATFRSDTVTAASNVDNFGMYKSTTGFSLNKSAGGH